MERNLIEVAELVKQEQRCEVRLAKLKEIKKAWDDLFFILAGEDVFKKMPEVSDYSSFEKRMRKSLEKRTPHNLIQAPATIHPPGDLLIQVEKLLSVDYSPPQSGEDIMADLIGLAEYYQSDFFSASIEMALDLSLCKLIRLVCTLGATARERGITTLSPTKAKKAKIAPRQTIIFEAFYRITNLKGKSLSRIAEIISERISSNGIKPPSPKTIKRYLTSDNKIKKDLIAMEVIKDKTGSVQ
jgi:hypothetical protein